MMKIFSFIESYGDFGSSINDSKGENSPETSSHKFIVGLTMIQDMDESKTCINVGVYIYLIAFKTERDRDNFDAVFFMRVLLDG